jgi:hypothetical protein
VPLRGVERYRWKIEGARDSEGALETRFDQLDFLWRIASRERWRSACRESPESVGR